MTDITERPQSLFMHKLKIALFIFLPVAVLINSVLWFFFYNEVNDEKNILKTHTSSMIKMQNLKIAGNFNLIVSDLLFFSSYNQLMDKLKNNEFSNKRLIDDFALFSRGSKIHDQIRLIDATGMEIIRIDFRKGKPIIVPKKQLQFKGRRYYFKDTIELDKGEVFISPFDLNIERGMIEQPLKPMIRFGTPVFDRKGWKRGIVIFNYLGANLIRDLKGVVADSPGFYMLLNSDGHWIIGRDAGDEWGFMYKDRKDLTMGNTYPEAWGKISASESGQFYNTEGLFTFTTVYPLLEGWKSSTGAGEAFMPSAKLKEAKEYYWKIVSYIPRKYLIEESSRALNKYIYISIIISLILGTGTWLLASAKVKHDIDEWNLAKYSEELEDRVEERTAEQAEANENLKDEIAERKKAEEKIREYSENLEHKVKERTKKLEEETEELHKSQQSLTYLIEDVNETKADLEKANSRLQELDRLKSMFIASMSHELRTPLNSIIGFSSIILNEWIGPINDEQKDNLNRVYKSGNHLLALINDIIDVSKIEAGKIEIFFEDADIHDIISESLSLFTNNIKGKKLELQTDIMHQSIHTDRRRLLQCVINLISNAVKFTEQGIITVQTRLLEDSELLSVIKEERKSKVPWIEISVTDTGIGIKDEDLPKLFLAFQRIDSHLTSTVKGTGLGLYLTKKIITEILNAKITVSSKHGEGSTFTVYIPVKPINNAEV